MDNLIDSKKNIITMLGLESLSEDKRLAILEKAVELVEKRVSARLLERLDEPALAQAGKLSGDALAAFFAEHVPDMGQIMEEETERVRGELATVVDALK